MAGRKHPGPPETSPVITTRAPTLPPRGNHEYQEMEELSEVTGQSYTLLVRKQPNTSDRQQMTEACSDTAVEEQTASSHSHQGAARSGTPSPEEDNKPSTGPVYAEVNKTKDDVTMVDNTLYYKRRY